MRHLPALIDLVVADGLGAVTLWEHADGTYDVVQTDHHGHITSSPELVMLPKAEAEAEFEMSVQWLDWTATRAARAAVAELDEEDRRGR